MTVPIVAENLSRTFGSRVAVQKLSFSVGPGEIYGLVGPDGAGKTTTLRLLAGALHPSAGAARIAGHDMARHPERGREALGYLPQRFSLYEELTVLENLRFFAEVRGLRRQDWLSRSMHILRFVDLEAFIHRRAGHLSGGMKQKLGLAVALVHNPRVLLLDEPTTGVDPVTRQDFWQLILGLAEKERIAVLVTTPYMDEASRCHRLGFMAEGRLLREGTPRDLCRAFEGQVLRLRGRPLRPLRAAAERIQGVRSAHLFGDHLHIHVEPGALEEVERALPRAAAAVGGTLQEVRAIAPTLEDVFASTIAAHQRGLDSHGGGDVP
jgi:ABC-2 type transport system ATP-binding protein